MRSGWYALPGSDPTLVGAAAAGGAAGCVSGCSVWGLWVPPDEPLHLAVPRNARRLRAPAGSVIHWTKQRGDHHPLDSLEECVRVAVECVEPASAFAIVESALRSRHRTPWMPDLLERAPLDRRALLRHAGTVSESGTESIIAFHLRRMRIPFRAQVEIGGVGRADFVIGDRLLVEADSEEHHGKARQRRKDLLRDTAAAALGFTTLRFDYTQVLYDWPGVELALRAAITHGDHRARRLRLA